jgi:hypothetical protein
VLAQALIANLRPGWKGLPLTNGVAYLVSSAVTKKKSCMKFVPAFLDVPGSEVQVSLLL